MDDLQAAIATARNIANNIAITDIQQALTHIVDGLEAIERRLSALEADRAVLRRPGITDVG